MATPAEFLDALRRYHLLEPAQLAELQRQLPGQTAKPRALARDLIARGWLTPYQANQILQGHGQELLLGSYVLLDKLGEGGMGADFKARNWELAPVVELTLIRQARVERADDVKRSRGEVRAAVPLDHPRLFRAFDADEVNGIYLLVMEFVAGT